MTEMNPEDVKPTEHRKPQVALMGGSFNPVHVGHLMVAAYVAQHLDDIDAVWLNLSPLNPLKATDGAASLAPDAHRLEMLRLACEASGIHHAKPTTDVPPRLPMIGVCDVELAMPRPSYTIDTLQLLETLHPDTRFTLLIGSDNWLAFPRWRAAEEIISRYGVIVYPRPGYAVDAASLPEGVRLVDAPTADISATFLRAEITAGRIVNSYLPAGVADYINKHNLYR